MVALLVSVSSDNEVQPARHALAVLGVVMDAEAFTPGKPTIMPLIGSRARIVIPDGPWSYGDAW